MPNDAAIGQPTLTGATGGFTVKHAVAEGKLKVLLYDIGRSVVDAGTNDLMRIPYSGSGAPIVSHCELTDYNGRPYRTAAKAALPTDFELMQNYPNPFNPSTTISFLMPQCGDWNLTVYNITGAVVTEFTGVSEGGRVDVVWDGTCTNGEKVASGVYFYRLDAHSFSETKKMMLLK